MLPPRPVCRRSQVHSRQAGPEPTAGHEHWGCSGLKLLQLHEPSSTSWGSNRDRSVKEKVKPEQLSLLGESSGSELGCGNKQGAGEHRNYPMDSKEGNERN